MDRFQSRDFCVAAKRASGWEPPVTASSANYTLHDPPAPPKKKKNSTDEPRWEMILGMSWALIIHSTNGNIIDAVFLIQL